MAPIDGRRLFQFSRQASQSQYNPASQRLALQYAQNNALAAQARAVLRGTYIADGRPQRQAH